MYSAAVCDSQGSVYKISSGYLQRFFKERLEDVMIIPVNGDKLMELCQSDASPFDVLILNADSCSNETLSAAVKLRESHPKMLLLFMTCYMDFPSRALNISREDCLLMPFGYETFELRLELWSGLKRL